MNVYSCNELDMLLRGVWIECSDALPPCGAVVIVEKFNGSVTALARYIDYENAPPERGYWADGYLGHNVHVFTSIVRWQPLPHPSGK